MTPRNLFNLVLKIFGLYFIRDLFLTISPLLSAIYLFKNGQAEDAVWTIVSSTIVITIEACICYYLIFKTDLIINKLRLLDGFDQKIIPIQMDRSTLLSISLIIIGGLILTDEIPNLCRRVYTYFQQKRMNYNQDDKEIPFLILTTVKIILGFLILSERKRIVGLIEKKKVQGEVS